MEGTAAGERVGGRFVECGLLAVGGAGVEWWGSGISWMGGAVGIGWVWAWGHGFSVGSKVSADQMIRSVTFDDANAFVGGDTFSLTSAPPCSKLIASYLIDHC